MAILGIVALIAVVGLILLFSGKLTGKVVVGNIYSTDYAIPTAHVYGRAPGLQEVGSMDNPYSGTWVTGKPQTWEGQNVAVVGGSQAVYRVPSPQTACPPNTLRMGTASMRRLSDDQLNICVDGGFGDGSMCCPTNSIDPFGGTWQ